MAQEASRDNNFNLIRMLAAAAVLISHSYPITIGPGAVEPLENIIGTSLGTLAVYIFFSVSGYLISASYANRGSISAFAAARFFRIVPGLISSVIFVALIFGPIFTTLSLSEYVSNLQTWRFLVRNVILFSPAYELPGVFVDNPYTAVVGSIWTIFYEIVCYLVVAIAGVVGVFRSRVTAMFFSLSWAILSASYASMEIHTLYQIDQFMRLSYPFAVGFFLWAIKPKFCPSALICVGSMCVALLLVGTKIFFPIFVVSLAMLTLYLAFAKSALLIYNRFGDYSYGFYLYAFPVQGAVVFFLGVVPPIWCSLVSIPATLILAYFSWVLIERPALSAMRTFNSKA